MKHVTTLFIVCVILLSACTPLGQESSISDQRLKEFSTSEDLTAFLKEHQNQQGGYYGGPVVLYTTSRDGLIAEAAPSAQKSTSSTGGTDFSQTNVQVEGVDEADIVKNDNKYIYTLTQDKLVIVDAYPPASAKVLTTLDIPGNPRDLFINKDRLVVFTDLYQPIYYAFEKRVVEDTAVESRFAAPDILPGPYTTPKTGVLIYDTTNKEDPQLVGNYTVEGNYYQSRMIDNYVYVVAQHSPSYGGGPIPLPALRSEDRIIMESPVSYFDNWEPQINFNSIASFNIQDADDVNLQTFMLGYANTLYVSNKNLYITYQKQIPYAYYQKDQENRFTKIIIPLLPNDLQREMYALLASTAEEFYIVQQRMYERLEAYYNELSANERTDLQQNIDQALQTYEYQLQEERMRSVVHKLSLEQGIVRYEGKGEFKGTLLNQFSLDEYNDYLRVATTVSLYSNQGQKMYNNVYVLDDDLDVVGELEQLAPEERIYSTRFIGDRLYMVTFKQVDPLFVIDLQDPEAPKVLGKLKIPGFSNYLHPYDETHILGLGQDTVEEQGRTMTGGLKIALFDVSDVENPKEEAKLIIGGRGTYSESLYDHKAFLFDSNKQVIVFPVSETKDNNWQRVWQGAYVLRVKENVGFIVAARIAHGTYDPEKNPDMFATQVRRSLYIDDVLYTLSPSRIKMHDLSDLKMEYKTIVLPYKQPDYGNILF